jgi:hypothetical protein
MKKKVQKGRTLALQRFLQGEDQERQRKKAPKGKSESPWSLHIGSFWKTYFINPPEVRGQVVRLKRKEGITMVKK